MIGFPFSPFSPYWWVHQGFGVNGFRNFGNFGNRPAINRLDVGGIYELSTNAVDLTEESVDYGINPCCYAQLPCECIVLLKVHADVPAGGEALPVNLVLPNSGRTTLGSTTPAGAASNTSRTPILDSQGTQIVGEDIEGNTERLAYINKRTGVIRFLEFTSGAA